MAPHTNLEILAVIIRGVASLLTIATGWWAWRQLKLPCLPWVIACWILQNPWLSLINAWVLRTAFVPGTSSKPLSASTFVRGATIGGYFSWWSLTEAVASFGVMLLIMMDVALVVQRLKPQVNNRLTRGLGLLRQFSPFLGCLVVALTLATTLFDLYWNYRR